LGKFKSSNPAKAEKLFYWLDDNIFSLDDNNKAFLFYDEMAYYFYLTLG
jgi:hypothetical protein